VFLCTINVTTTLIPIAGIAATLLVAGTVAVASNHSAFAWKEYKKGNNYQRDDNKYPTDGSERSGISVPVTTSQDLECQTAGGTSPIRA
jgi:hypothetical protein